NQRIEFRHAINVLHIGVEFVTQTEVQIKLRSHAPIVLNKTGEEEVVSIRNQQGLSWFTTSYCYGEQEIVVVNPTVIVTIKVRKIFDHLNAPLLEDAQIEGGIDALQFTSNSQRVTAADHREIVGKLEPALLSSLGNAK